MPRRKKTEYEKYLESAEWAAIRDAVTEQYGGECCICGKTADDGTLNVHHWRYPAQLADDDTTNCVLMCAHCHAAVHPNKRATDADEYIDEIRRARRARDETIRFGESWEHDYLHGTVYAHLVHKKDDAAVTVRLIPRDAVNGRRSSPAARALWWLETLKLFCVESVEADGDE